MAWRGQLGLCKQKRKKEEFPSWARISPSILLSLFVYRTRAVLSPFCSQSLSQTLFQLKLSVFDLCSEALDLVLWYEGKRFEERVHQSFIYCLFSHFRFIWVFFLGGRGKSFCLNLKEMLHSCICIWTLAEFWRAEKRLIFDIVFRFDSLSSKFSPQICQVRWSIGPWLPVFASSATYRINISLALEQRFWKWCSTPKQGHIYIQFC